MELVFAYAAGLLTLINPCVLPVLPIVLAGALQASRWGPAALAAGMGLSFVALGLLVTAAGRSLGLTEETVSQAGAVLMLGFGLILLVPAAGRGFALATAGVSARADAGIDGLGRQGAGGQFLGGALLGAVWSPCIGPTLGAAISLASQGQNIAQAGAVMTAFAAGVATLILAIGYGLRAALARNRALMMTIATRARPLMGAVFVAVGLAILFRVHHAVEAWALETLPPWLIDLSVSL
ncbi:MAG: cytochrome c biogenesis CcdA family protein [Rhodobacteraceae bacterium]|jgi:cytochrome c biogenesis protein CcdA|nr:cytochrome c biogenesis CcdA family protein [Paracoccaceae bacterium]